MLPGNELGLDVVTLEELAVGRHEVVVVGVGQDLHGLEALLLHLLGQGEDPVEVHVGGHEVDPGPLHGRHLGAQVRDAEGQGVVVVGDLGGGEVLERVASARRALLRLLGDPVGEQRYPFGPDLRSDRRNAAPDAAEADGADAAEQVVLVGELGVDVPPERGDRLALEEVRSSEDQRAHEDGEHIVLGEHGLDLGLVVGHGVVALAGEPELASVEAAGGVDHLEVGLDPGVELAVVPP